MNLKYLLILILLCSFSLTAYSSKNYQKSEKTKLYTISLELPKEILSITPLKEDLLKRFKVGSVQVKKIAQEVKKQRPGYFSPLSLEIKWHVTFENSNVISIMGMIYEYQGGAHPNNYYEAIVWDKKLQKAIPLGSLFNENQSDLAFKAIAEAAQKSWIKIYSERSHEAPSAELKEQSKQGIKPDAQSLKNYVLTHAKGQTKANGIMLLYGAGEIWPHVLGEFCIPIPQAVFKQYLNPEWRDFFTQASEPKACFIGKPKR